MNHGIHSTPTPRSTDFELAERLVSRLLPEQQHRYHGLVGFMNGQNARASGVGTELQRARDSLFETEESERIRAAALQRQRNAMGEDERTQFAERKERKQRQVEATERASEAASKDAGNARDVAHPVIIYLSKTVSGAVTWPDADTGAEILKEKARTSIIPKTMDPAALFAEATRREEARFRDEVRKVLTPKTVKLGRATLEDQLVANREEQAELRREFERVRNAGTPIEVLKGQVLQSLEARQGDPFAVMYFDGQATLKEPALAVDAAPLLPGRVVTAPDPLPMMLALFGEEIRTRVLARIDRDHEGDNSLRIEAGEKRRLLTDTQARILELQYVEGALITEIAGPDALEIPFRKGMDPRAVLGVVGPPPKPF